VGSLPWSVNDEELKETFEKHGPVVSAKVNAISALNDSELNGRNIVVNEAKSRN
jgi:RNA recognition motif-containing protein